MQQPSRVAHVVIVLNSWLLLLIVSIHAFWVSAFFVNGLHHYAYEDIYWQRTPSAGHVPFTALSHLPTFMDVALMAAMVVHPFGSVVLPLQVVWVGSRLRWNRDVLPWTTRMFALGALALAVPMVVFLWSPLGSTITTWLMD
jgi:hypothetical protein